MRKIFKWTAVGIAVVFVGIQFIRPVMSNPPIDADKTLQAKSSVPPEVDKILARSCNDCHSNNTNWVWYSNIAPGSWRMAHHVDEGRRELNFSEYGDYSPKKAAHKLEEICEQVKTGEMPLWDYVLLHPSARLSDADKEMLCNWANAERGRIEVK